jgi:transposase
MIGHAMLGCMEVEVKKRDKWRAGLVLTREQISALEHARVAAQAEGDHLFDRRLRSILLVGESLYTQESVGEIFEVTENAVTRWVMAYSAGGIEALRSRYAPGKTPALTLEQKRELFEGIRRGPEANGFDTGVWDGKLVQQLISKRFGVGYSVAHVRRLLNQLGFTLQYPKKILARADPEVRRRWQEKQYPAIKEKAVSHGNAVLYVDESVFQQEGTILRTWAIKGEGTPSLSEPCRRSVKA